MNYKQAYVTMLIRKRAEERAELAGGRFTNESATHSIVPFTEWLYYKHGISDYKKVKKYDLTGLWYEYKCDCIEFGMLAQTPKLFGLDCIGY